MMTEANKCRLQKPFNAKLLLLTHKEILSLRGSIAVLALWSICFMATLSVILAGVVRTKAVIAKRLESRQNLISIGEAGAYSAIFQILKVEVKGYDALNEPWSDDAAVFKDMRIGEKAYATVKYNFLTYDMKTLERYGFVDEESKLNINVLDLLPMARLLNIAAGVDPLKAQDIAAAIIDWRDNDPYVETATGGAEDFYYLGLTPAYQPKNSPFEAIEELILVKDITVDIFEKIKNYVTIYGNGNVNINTANKVVLMSTGLSEVLADKVLQYRAGMDGIEGSADDNIFENPGNIVPQLSQAYHFSDREISELSSCAGYFGTSATCFSALISARVVNAKEDSLIRMVCNRSGKILSWNER